MSFFGRSLGVRRSDEWASDYSPIDLDGDGDGRITSADVIWADLKVWQDRNQNGVTDAGELSSLDALGIVSLSLASTPIGTTTPQGTQLIAGGEVTFASGRVSRMFEAIFDSSDVDTKYVGEGGRADWQREAVVDSKGIGNMTGLAVAAANDLEFGELVAERAAAMTAPSLKALVAQAGDVLGAWAQTLGLPANDNGAWRSAPFRLSDDARRAAA